MQSYLKIDKGKAETVCVIQDECMLVDICWDSKILLYYWTRKVYIL